MTTEINQLMYVFRGGGMIPGLNWLICQHRVAVH
jgi:hypothetical protein